MGSQGCGLGDGYLLVKVGRAVLAQPSLAVEADRLADPGAAPSALLENRADLFGGFPQCSIMGYLGLVARVVAASEDPRQTCSLCRIFRKKT
jgi:hypothetical protein